MHTNFLWQIVFVLAAAWTPFTSGEPGEDGTRHGYESDQFRLVKAKLANYDNKVKPTFNTAQPISVNFSMDLYQLLELNEPQQYVLLNAWIIERWHDEFLFWDPRGYNNITEIRLPHEAIWLPDTTLYNSLVMKDEDQRRLLNAKLMTRLDTNTTFIEMLYPAIFKFSCLLNLRYFPYDVQRCRMIFSSWTYDKGGIDYFSHNNATTIGNLSFIENEGWGLLKTLVTRVEEKYNCCVFPYALLHYDLFLRRKPLFYLVNLIIPTSIITLIALVGFFTTSSASGMREEKVSLGITTLLSMSILMLMVSDQMPTTSTFIPLIGWFILGMIVIISLGTLASTVVIAVQKRGRMGIRLSLRVQQITKFFSYVSLTEIPEHLKGAHLVAVEAGNGPILSVSTTQQSLLQSGRTEGIRRPSELPVLALPPQASPLTSLATPVNEDDLSSIGDITEIDNVEAPKPNLKKGPVIENPSPISKGITLFTANVKQNRKYAETEYEWLATVLERCFFVLFVFVFVAITVGINAVGYYHWVTAEKRINEDPDYIKIK